MELEAVLRQNAELEEFLESLVVAHAKAVQEQGLEDRLDGIRRDIAICFNDLTTLNGMLTSCDGQIREEIDFLQKCRQKIGKLNRKRRQLIEKRDQWSNGTDIEVGKYSPVSFTIDSSYRAALEQYLKLADGEDDTDSGSPERTWRTLKILNLCRDGVSQSIKQATELLHEFHKDQEFFEREFRTQSARVRRKINAIDDEIGKNNVARRELLSRVGLPLRASKESSRAQRLLHLNLNNGGDQESEEEDIANHAEEFIEMKIASLQDQLTYKKENSSSLAVDRDLWNDCIECVKKLEDRIKSVLSDDKNLSNATTAQMRPWMEQSLQELTEIIASTDNRVLVKLVRDEREVIEKAYHEISKRTEINDTTSASKNGRSNPSFLVVSKSPPKIAVTDKTAQRSNNDSTSSGSLTFLKDKSKKKE
ncbi:hypothetical protein HG537_0C05720 [Torulaspora globosa]|uniref:Uncharacterized protein n=1 Tax=Torulaspora globosa TaxID=48254 RepID=A0A7H9HRL9_9SACH|nr:hypothetical protein HG537_0C05720 [Torulaspora sp. CBS 2947]